MPSTSPASGCGAEAAPGAQRAGQRPPGADRARARRRVKRLAGKIDRVLVDAPCSGSGTLRRNPDLKWRQSADSVAALVPTQAAILRRRAAGEAGRSPRLCDLQRAGGGRRGVALEFDLASNAQFARVPAVEALQQARVSDAAALVSGNDLRLLDASACNRWFLRRCSGSGAESAAAPADIEICPISVVY